MTVEAKVLNAVKNFLNGAVNDRYSDPEIQVFSEVLLRLIEDEDEKATNELINSFINPTP